MTGNYLQHCETLLLSSYTCFTGTRVLGQLGEIGPEYLKSPAGTHEK